MPLPDYLEERCSSPDRRLRKTLRSSQQNAFLDTLRAARAKAELTQQELADRLGKPQSFVAKYEKGERRIDVVEFVVLADAIGVEPLSLFRTFLKRAREA